MSSLLFHSTNQQSPAVRHQLFLDEKESREGGEGFLRFVLPFSQTSRFNAAMSRVVNRPEGKPFFSPSPASRSSRDLEVN